MAAVIEASERISQVHIEGLVSDFRVRFIHIDVGSSNVAHLLFRFLY